MGRVGAAIPICSALLAVTIGVAAAQCDEAARAAVKQAVTTACPCDAGTRRAYRGCVARETRRLVLDGQSSVACAQDVRKCAARSTCGRVDRVACCRAQGDASTCRITTPERCAARGGCASPYASCCDACAGSGCATTTTIGSTTTTTVQGTCGNGIIEPGEWCDGDEVCSPQCTIERVACCSIDTPSGLCSANVPAFTLMSNRFQVCNPSYGGTFRLGKIRSSGGACADLPTGGPGIPSNALDGECVDPPPLATTTSICCQDTATTCSDVTTNSMETVSTFVVSCLASHYPNYPVVVGACTSRGECQPAH